MTNNDFFRFILHWTGLGRNKELTIQIFKMGGIEATTSKIKGWRTTLDNPRASYMPDKVLSGFMQGMFLYRDKHLVTNCHQIDEEPYNPDFPFNSKCKKCGELYR